MRHDTTGVVSDLAKRQSTDEMMARLAAIVTSSEDCIFARNLQGVITSWNAGAERLYGYTAAEIVGTSGARLAPADRLDEIPRLLERILRGEQLELFDTVRLDRNGNRIDVSLRISPILDASGSVVGAAAIARDISDRKRREKALRRSEAQLAESQQIAHVGSWELDLATRQLSWSEEHYRIFGLAPSTDPLGVATAIRTIHPDDQATVLARLDDAIAHHGSYACELRLVRPDGSIRWIQSRGAFVESIEGGGPGRMVGTAQDITERVEAQRHQAQLTEHTRLLLASTSDGIYSIDSSGNCTFINEGGAALLGYTPDELVGQPMHARVHHHDADGGVITLAACPIHEAMRTGVACRLHTIVLSRKDDTLVPTEAAINPLFENGRVIGVVVAFQDVSERKSAEAHSRESEERLRQALDTAGLGTWDLDLQQDRIVWSESVERMMGLEPGTFGGTMAAFQSFVHTDDLARVGSAIATAVATGDDFRAEFRMKSVDGTVKWMDASGKVIYDVQHQPARLLGVTRDVTARKLADQQREALHRSEKLRALGQMASGIAHDLNQSLMLVASYSDLARAALDREHVDHDELREMFTIASQAAIDGGETVKRLLQFGRAPVNEERQRVDLGQVVREAVSLSAPRWRDAPQSEGRPISLHVEINDKAVVLGSPGYLREVMTNLLFNAVDALPAGGTIRVRVSVVNEQAVVEMIDSGVGMPPDVQAQIFEPFFTTKGEHGTGLGLAQVFGIVEQHGGRIDVLSAPGAGTTLRLSFPLAPAGGAAADGLPVAPAELQHGLRILIVDDEPAMVKAVARMLRPTGHVVQTAGSGEEALESLATASFDVVVSDLGMGAGMNGWDLAATVHREWPRVRFVLATGWGAGIDQAEAANRGVAAVLAKPYRLADLQQALVEAVQLPLGQPAAPNGSRPLPREHR